MTALEGALTGERSRVGRADARLRARSTDGPVSGKDIAPGTTTAASRGTTSSCRPHARGAAAAQPRRARRVPRPGARRDAAPKSQDAIAENYRLHQILVDGYRGISYIDSDGIEQNPTIRLVSHDAERQRLARRQPGDDPVRGDLERRFDIVLYLNGMPVGDHRAEEGRRRARRRRRRPRAAADLPARVPDGVPVLRASPSSATASPRKYGTPFTPLNHFSPWNVDDDGSPVASGQASTTATSVTELETALDGLYNQERFLQLLRNFTAFDEGADGLAKRIAKPHQYFAVTKAVGSTVAGGRDQRQGRRRLAHPGLRQVDGDGALRQPGRRATRSCKNPTVVVVTDRNELDGQLFETFDQQPAARREARCRSRTRAELRDELTNRVTGGIYFTTLQKFGLTEDEKDAGADHPLLSDRRNIIVIVDEAHRSHYDDLDGYARHLRDALPNATLIAFTGTPISFDRPQHPRRLRRLHRHLRPHPRRRRRRHRPVYFEPRLIKVGARRGRDRGGPRRAPPTRPPSASTTPNARGSSSPSPSSTPSTAHRSGSRRWPRTSSSTGRAGARAMRQFIESPGQGADRRRARGRSAPTCTTAIVELRPDWHSDDLDKGKIKVVYSGIAVGPAAGRRARAPRRRRTRRSRSGSRTPTTSSRS